jgi:hypothetical protein
MAEPGVTKSPWKLFGVLFGAAFFQLLPFSRICKNFSGVLTGRATAPAMEVFDKVDENIETRTYPVPFSIN